MKRYKQTSIACVPVCNYFTSDNRVMRTCRVLKDCGYEVHVLALGRDGLSAKETVAEGITVHRFGLETKKKLKKCLNVLSLLGYAYYLFRSVRFVAAHSPAILHLNDWETVPIAWLGRSFGRRRVVYDMHEFFQDQASHHYPKAVRPLIAWIDRLGLRKAHTVICVSPFIADELRRVTDRPVVTVRNIPELPPTVHRRTDSAESTTKRLVYLGALGKRMDWHWVIDVVKLLPDDYTIDFFTPETPVRDELAAYVREQELLSRARFFDPVPHDKLFPILGNAYAGLSLLLPSCRKFDFALPNKFFEYLQAGLPVVTTDITAQAQIVRDHGLGLVLDYGDAQTAADTLRAWTPCPITSDHLSHIGLTWNHERVKLEKIYHSA